MAVYTFITILESRRARFAAGQEAVFNRPPRAVKEANFSLCCAAPKCRAVLIELGYLSNPISELQLRSSRYTDHMARGIADGLLQYPTRV